MLHIAVPGAADLRLEHLLLDINGTLTDRGELIAGVAEALAALTDNLDVHALSADTYGTAEALAEPLGAAFCRVQSGEDKLRYIWTLGPDTCVAVGNGRNDALMLRAAALGIGVVGPEGAHVQAVAAANVVTRSITEALALLADPRTLTATLRP
jgi:P-type E1-E2 ATPase